MNCPDCEQYIPFAKDCACKLYPKKCPYEKTIKEFEEMRNMAELKALSALSLEQELTGEQFERMKELRKILMESD